MDIQELVASQAIQELKDRVGTQEFQDLVDRVVRQDIQVYLGSRVLKEPRAILEYLVTLALKGRVDTQERRV